VKTKLSDDLERVKKNIRQSHDYFKDNFKRYHEYRNYVYKSSLSENQKAMLRELHRPILELNLLPAHIASLLGEFAKQEPGIEVTPAEGVPVKYDVLEVVEGHLRHIIHQANKDSFSYEMYKTMISGGFSVAKVYTEFDSPMSFEQSIYWRRVFDPTMTIFDPMARASHKGDGNYCGEVFPMYEDDFVREFDIKDLPHISYMRDIEGFTWSYKNQQNDKIILLCDYYEKKKKRTQIVKLANGKVMRKREYEKLESYWNQSFFEQMPKVVGKPRWTELDYVCRYQVIENKIIDYEETDYIYLPYVFFAGESVQLTQGTGNTAYDFCIPYAYHAKGTQDLKNFSGIALGNYLQNQIQHKYIIKKEAIPQEEDYLQALNDIQRANTLVVNAYSENNPDKPIPEPIREVVNVQAPPQLMETFNACDITMHNILAGFSSNQAKNYNYISGKAIIESASQGNASAMPYIVGYLAGLTQMANITVDLMPKYLTGKRTIPVVNKKGDKTYQDINNVGVPYLDYEERAIKVNIDAGVNFQVQKNQALQQIIALMQASTEFNQFMNSPHGLPILVKNLTIYSADELEEAVPLWISQQEQQKQQAMQAQQQAMMQNPQMIRAQVEMQKVQQEAQQSQFENQIEIAKLAIEKEQADANLLIAESKVTGEQIDSAVRLEEAQTSQLTHALDAAAKFAEIQSRKEGD